MNQKILPELLAPAGNFERFQTALVYGADAVYLGGKDLNLRAQAQGFAWSELGQALDLAHQKDRKIYYCLNILPREEDLLSLRERLGRLKDYPVDGLIVADPGVVTLAKEIVPDIPIHLSTQANTTNSLAVRFWQQLGVTRINLARELNLKTIRSIRQEVQDLELEVFIHGAMCLAISGKCHLSAYLNQRSANLGLCTHPCRYAYRIIKVGLEEKKRPGKTTWELHEGNDYSNILASEDLGLIKYLAWFINNRINALKIEGRMKTSSYLGPIVDTYKTALQDYQTGHFRTTLYLEELSKTVSRPLSTGFFLPGTRKIHLQPKDQKPPVLGKVISQEQKNTYVISVRHRWFANSSIQILLPGLRRPCLKPQDYGLEDEAGNSLTVAHSGSEIRLKCDFPFLAPNLLIRENF